ncbi:archaellum component FlaC [Chryseobacterium sp. JUb7]|nr:archaellum component FlaC [Chryseobacterium sp. JUb7]
MLFDNSSLESIREFKEKFENEEGRVHDPLFEFQD